MTFLRKILVDIFFLFFYDLLNANNIHSNEYIETTIHPMEQTKSPFHFNQFVTKKRKGKGNTTGRRNKVRPGPAGG